MSTIRWSFEFLKGRLRPALRNGALVTLACSLLLPAIARGQTQITKKWEPQGPGPAVGGQSENASPNDEISGAIHVVLSQPNNPKIVYIGSVNGGVWKANQGTSAAPNWRPLTDGMPTSAIGALTFDSSDPTYATLWAGVGTWSSLGRLGGNRVGLYVTRDGGDSWSLVDGSGVLFGKNIAGLAASGNTIVAAVDTADAFTFGNIGIWRSTDGGAHFTQIATGTGAATGLPGGVTYDLVADPTNPARLFTSVVFANLVGGTNGVYRSNDTGATWSKVSNAAMDALLISGTTNNVEFAAGRANNVYCAISNGGRLAGLFRSGDGGATWTAMDRPATGTLHVGIHPGAQGSIHLSMAADPGNASLLYLGGDRQPGADEEQGNPALDPFPNSIGAENYSGRLFRCDASQPSGSQCVPLTHVGTAHNSSPHADSREMTVDAAGNLLETDDGGIWRRTNPSNATGDWFSISNNLQVSEQHDASYDALSNITFVGTQDNDDPYQGAPNDPLWAVLLSGDGGDTAIDNQSLAPDFSLRYDSAQQLLAFIRTYWDAGNNLLAYVFPDLTPTGGAPRCAGQFTTPVEVNAINPQRLIFGCANGVYETFDQGDTVSRIATQAINGSGVDPVSYGGLGNADLLVYGAGDRLFKRSAAPPAAPAEVLTYPRTPGITIRDIVIDPADANAWYLTNRNEVWRTTDGGATWNNLTGNIQSFAPIALRAIAYVPRTPGDDALVVSSFNGIYVSYEKTGFNVWSPVTKSLPNVPVMDLQYDATNQVLVAGTLGRGAWKLSVKQ